ncbi:MAG: hypothetical protein EOO62_15420, partial [Hymenobacter sp.]
MLPLLNEMVSPALVRGVGYALLHSLWQGGVLALLLAGVLPLLRRHRAEVRYAASAAALGTLVLAVGLTFGYYYQTTPTVVVADNQLNATLSAQARPAAASSLAAASTDAVAAAPAA